MNSHNFLIRDLEINKLCKFYAAIFSLSKAKIFSIAGLRSKSLTQLKGKRANKMRRLLFAKSLHFIKPILSLVLCLSFLPNEGLALLDSELEKWETQAITSDCDFEAKLLIERSPKCGNLGGVVSVWVTENEAPVTYFWKADGGEMFSTGTVNTLENVPANITHWAIIRDASGCEIMLDFELVEQPCICPLTARAIINKYPECGGANGSVRIEVVDDQGEVSFDSDDVDWGPSARKDNLSAGSYSVTVTDEADCKVVLNFDLTESTCCQNYAATAVVNKLPDCGESNGSVSIDVVGQNGEVTYSWGDGNRRDNLAAGEYWVVVRDETGCSVTVYFKIAGENCCVDTDLTATAVIHQEPACGQNNGSTEIVATGGVAPYTYSWGEKSRYDNLNPGNYRVTVTDAYGCTAEVIFELTRADCCKDSDLSATATINRQPACGQTNGSATINVAGGIAPYKYSWGSLSSYDNLIPGYYIVTVTDAFGCAAVVNFALTQEDCCKDSDLTVTPIINKHPECGKRNGSVDLAVTGGMAPYAYSWGGQSSFDNLVPGNYTVTITDAFDCMTVTDFELIEGPCCPNFAVELMIQ
ncbi:MAG: SprB repeat-containing protein, partial [Saprospiraceae bacterium]